MSSALTIFTGCEKSRVVADAFERLGHTAWSCDLEPSYHVSDRHLQMDVFAGIMSVPAAIDLAILFPECRCLCSSGQHRTGKPGQRTQVDVDKAVTFFMRCVEVAEQLPAAIIENSIGIMSRLYRKPDMIIQPYWFGEDASKATCLWTFGKLRGKVLTPTEFVPPRMVCNGCKRTTAWEIDFGEWRVKPQSCNMCYGRRLPRWSNQTDSGQNRLPPSPDRSARRADFYPGVAEALAKQLGGVVTEQS